MAKPTERRHLRPPVAVDIVQGKGEKSCCSIALIEERDEIAMAKVEKPNLVLQFKLEGDPEGRIYTAERIKVDGKGGLTLYGDSSLPEWIQMARLRAFSIRPIRYANQAA